MGRVRLAGLRLVVGALLVAGCATAREGASTTAAPTTAVATTTTVASTTSTAAPTTSTAAPTTSPTTAPAEPWIVAGRVYYFPVQPPEAASYGRDHHDYPATDIFAPVGTPLVAVVAGVVDEMSATDEWDPSVDDPATRSGRYVTMIGDDGIRYHTSHLDTVAPEIVAGARVAAGQRIGTVGNSGNAAATPSHVHFGISRPSFAGDWEGRRGEVWPWPYLDAWQDGEDLAPVLEG